MLKTLRFICFQKHTACVSRKFSYKSEISTGVLYPNSKQKLFTPDPPAPVSCANKEILFIEYQNSKHFHINT